MKIFLYITVIILTNLFCSVAQENQQKTEKLENKVNAQKLEQALEIMEALTTASTGDEKKLNCLKVFGDEDFCNCVAENLPMGITFFDYVEIAAGKKDVLEKYKHYDNKTKKELVEMAKKTSTKCIDTHIINKK